MLVEKTKLTRPENVPVSLAAGGVVVRQNNGKLYVALVREADHHQYILPKGSVEPGETLEMTAIREIAEEAGIWDMKLIGKLGVRERLNYRKTFWKVTHYFLFLTEVKTTKPSDAAHVYYCEWFPLDDLPEFFWPEQKQLLVDNRAIIHDLVSASKPT